MLNKTFEYFNFILSSESGAFGKEMRIDIALVMFFIVTLISVIAYCWNKGLKEELKEGSLKIKVGVPFMCVMMCLVLVMDLKSELNNYDNYLEILDNSYSVQLYVDESNVVDVNKDLISSYDKYNMYEVEIDRDSSLVNLRLK